MNSATLADGPLDRPVDDPFRGLRRGEPWLAVVAHPDDESFGCGSTLARAAQLGAEVTVACATRGEAGEADARHAGCGDLGAIREAELHRASARLGVARVELLGYRDSGFDGDLTPGSLCGTPVGEVARVLGRLLAGLRPRVVVVLDGSDGHRDHLHIRTATRTALQALPVGEPPAGEPTAVPPRLYEHSLPNSLMRRWLEEMRTARPDTVYHTIDPATFGRRDAEITCVVDVGDVLLQREAAIAEHRSQSSPFDGLSEGLRRAFLTTDHLVHVPLR